MLGGLAACWVLAGLGLGGAGPQSSWVALTALTAKV